MGNYTVILMALAIGLAFGIPALISVLRQRHGSK
jgi:hypothetical protein